MAYITLEEFSQLGGPADRIASYRTDLQQQHIDAASAQADEYLGMRYAVPLDNAHLTPAIKLHVARLAFFYLVTQMGYQPENDGGALQGIHAMAIRYFERLASGTVVVANAPSMTVRGGATPSAEVFSDEARGW